MAKEHEKPHGQPRLTTAETVAPSPKKDDEASKAAPPPDPGQQPKVADEKGQQLPQAEAEAEAVPRKPAPPPGRNVLNYLVSTGTNPDRLEPGRKALEEKPDATSEEVYKALEGAGVALGTLRKAGKYIWGDAWEPNEEGKAVSQDELTRLREENAQLRGQLEQANASKLGFQKQRDHFEKKLNDAVNENRILRAGKSNKELERLGIHKPADEDGGKGGD
jgi:hypothetical protein